MQVAALIGSNLLLTVENSLIYLFFSKNNPTQIKMVVVYMSSKNTISTPKYAIFDIYKFIGNYRNMN